MTDKDEYPDNDLPLGAEIAGWANREISKQEASDRADDKQIEQWDTLGGQPPDGKQQREDERVEGQE